MTNINKGNIQKYLIKYNENEIIAQIFKDLQFNLPKLIINNLKKKVGINGEIIMPTYLKK